MRPVATCRLFFVACSLFFSSAEAEIYSIPLEKSPLSGEERASLLDREAPGRPIVEQPSKEACLYFHYLNSCWGQNSCYAKRDCAASACCPPEPSCPPETACPTPFASQPLLPPEEPMQLEDFYLRGFGFSLEPEEGALCGAGFGGWGGAFGYGGYGGGGGAGFGVAAADAGGGASGSAAAAAAAGADSTSGVNGEVVIPEPPLYWILAMALLLGMLVKSLRKRVLYTSSLKR